MGTNLMSIPSILSASISSTKPSRGVLPSQHRYWLGDKAELGWLTVKKAITSLEKSKHIPPDTVDPEEALNTIGLWKGSLIPPGAGWLVPSPYLPLVYAEYEKQRLAAFAFTFDDFIPMAIDILERDPFATNSGVAV